MLKKVFRALTKTKFSLFKKFYRPKDIISSKEARDFFVSERGANYPTTNWIEKFLYAPSIDLSIIVPVYNVQNTLEKCVISCEQNTNFDFEIILVDDGSTDHSGEICDNLAKIFGNIKVFHNQNSGLSFARNFGIVRSHGRFLMFVDSDDYIEPDTLQPLFDAAKSSDIVQAMYYKISNQNVEYKSKFVPADNLSDFSAEYGYAWGKLYKREIFANIKFPVGFWFEDMVNNLVIYPAFSKRVLISKYGYNYINNPAGITQSSKNSKKILDAYFVLESIILNFQNFGVEFSEAHFKRLLFETSRMLFARLRRFGEKYLECGFSLACDLVLETQNKYSIKTSSLSELDRELVDAYASKKFSAWKNIAVFYK